MDDSKSRAHLKALFRAGNVPTDADFKKLIQSQVNALDDQIMRRDDGANGDSLCIGAGQNQALLSFFSSLSNAGSDWSLQLKGDGGRLSFSGKNSGTPVMTLDATGKVGIGTDQPSASLDVRGDVQASSLTVAGTATVNALTITGLGTITDADSLRRLVNSQQGSNLPVVQQPSTLHVMVTHAPENQAPPLALLTPAPTPLLPAVTPDGPSQPRTVPALKAWQQVAGPFTGFQAMTVLAWMDSTDHRSICHATAVCINGDPHDLAIHHVQSYQGRPGSKISFRWHGTKTAYYLECRVGLKLPEGTSINLKINSLL